MLKEVLKKILKFLLISVKFEDGWREEIVHEIKQDSSK